jgi:hypothetical protein
LQNPHRLSRIIPGLRIQGLLVLQGPVRSRSVGVSHGCQAAESC